MPSRSNSGSVGASFTASPGSAGRMPTARRATASRRRQVAAFGHEGAVPPPGLPLADGDALMEELERLLAPVTELPNPLRAQIAEQAQEIIKLTERQYSLLAFLNRTRRAAISGC